MISIDYSLIIVILNFILLLVILNKYLFKPMQKFLSSRQEEVKSELKNAHENRIKAEEVLKQRNDELKSSSEEIRNLTKTAKKEAEQQAEEILKQAKVKEKTVIKETEDILNIKKTETVKEIESEIAKMVSDLTGKILEKKLNGDTDKKLIDSLIGKDK